jgi:hypothetical protein
MNARQIVSIALLVTASAFSFGGTTTTASAAGAYGPDTCAQGFVWRMAIPSDHVCVTPGSRSRVARENARAGQLWDVNGAYGSSSCIQGYVWREAFNGDVVCVTPARRTAVKAENAAAADRLAGDNDDDLADD